MAAALEGLILRAWDGVHESVSAVGGELVALAVDGLMLVPITNDVRDQIYRVGDNAGEGVANRDPVPGFYLLTSSLARRGQSLSLGGPVAYVHMEFFGGTGFHAAVGWRDGALCWGPRFTQSVPGEAEEHYEVVPNDLAINQVLRWFGVDRRDAVDEYAAVGLQRNRFTAQWINR